MQHRAYMPATIVVARGLLPPMQWCGRHFSALGQRVKALTIFLTQRIHSEAEYAEQGAEEPYPHLKQFGITIATPFRTELLFGYV